MKKLAAILLFSLALSSTSCAAWFQELKTNPILALQQGVQYIQVAVGLGDTAFYTWAAMQTDATLVAQKTAEYNRLKADVENGLVVAEEALQAAADASQAAPDPNVLLADSKNALTALNTFLAGLANSANPPASLTRALDATHHAAARHY